MVLKSRSSESQTPGEAGLRDLRGSTVLPHKEMKTGFPNEQCIHIFMNTVAMFFKFFKFSYLKTGTVTLAFKKNLSLSYILFIKESLSTVDFFSKKAKNKRRAK